MKKLYFILICLLAAHRMYAQEEEKHHLISAVIGHAHISKGLDENGSRKWIMAAAWGLDYTYNFNKKWAIGNPIQLQLPIAHCLPPTACCQAFFFQKEGFLEDFESAF